MTGGRYLIPVTEEPRVRRAADLTGAVIGLLVFLASLRSYQRHSDPETTLAGVVDWIPAWLTGTIRVFYGLALVYIVVLIVAILIQWRHRLDVVRDVFLALSASAIIVTFVVRWVTGSWPLYLVELGWAEPHTQFPIFRVTIVAATAIVTAPHLTRPLRRLGWAVVLVAGVSGVALGLGLPGSALGAVGLAAAASGLVLVIFGSPRGYPDLAAVSFALGQMGFEVRDIELSDDQSWGVRRLTARSDRYGALDIKAYGRDATDSQLFGRIWRYIWYRDREAEFSLTRMQNVEHEALVTMMAERAGASVPHVLTAGISGDDLALLAVTRSGTGLIDEDAASISDEVITGIWDSVSAMHDAGVAHGGLNAAAIGIDGPSHEIRDFGRGSLAAPRSRLQLDIVELLVSLSQLIGVERAVAISVEALGSERLEEVLPFVQLPAVTRGQRKSLAQPKEAIAKLRAALAEVTGADIEEQAQITRVQPRNLILTAVSVVAVYFLVSQLSGIDFASVAAVMGDADWYLIVTAFLVGQLVYLPEATAMLAAVGYEIPLRPVVILQSATRFISLAVPSAAGRVAMTATFLRKYGVSFTSSVVQGSIDTISGLLVEVTILILALLTGNLNLGLDTGETEWGPIVLIVIGLAVVGVFVVRRMAKLRERIVPVIAEAFGALRDVMRDPRRTFVLLLSNFLSRFTLAIAMWLILRAVDAPLGLWLTLTATVATGLLGGIVPIPGGVGVSEAVLAAFLIIFGIDETTAFAAAVTYRVATFYIPSAAGFLSMRWLEKNGYI